MQSAKHPLLPPRTRAERPRVRTRPGRRSAVGVQASSRALPACATIALTVSSASRAQKRSASPIRRVLRSSQRSLRDVEDDGGVVAYAASPQRSFPDVGHDPRRDDTYGRSRHDVVRLVGRRAILVLVPIRLDVPAVIAWTAW